MRVSEFKVLLVYPNFQMSNMLLPAGVSILSSVLKEEGIQVELFDTTLYPPPGKSFDKVRLDMLQLKKFKSIEEESGTKKSHEDMEKDFIALLDDFKPNLVACSVLQDTYPIAKDMLALVKERNIPVLLGGIWPTFAPEDALSEPCVDYICKGEGEKMIVDFCKAMAEDKPFLDLPNLGYCNEQGEKVINPLGPLVNVNELPHSDYSIFEKDRFIRPMQGKLFRTLPIEIHRGCPYKCAFCEDPQLNVIYKEQGNYHRSKDPQRVIDELLHFVENYGADYIYFNAETFFAMPDKNFVRLADLYAEHIRLPFWIQTRPETITEKRVEKLKQMGAANINIGLEHGNEEFRAKVLKRRMKNELIIKGLQILHDYGLKTTVNNIMGFPDETRDLIFDTIELNRHIQSATINAYLFNPYKGTDLYKVCEEKGYLPGKDDEKVIDPTLSEEYPYFKTILNMPQISKMELLGLQRTFVLYSKLPKADWDRIKVAERFDEEGNNMFKSLCEQFNFAA